MRKLKILVATHKKAPMPINKTLYLPILVNAKRNYQADIDYQRDDIAENISHKNANYNELTAIYWAWKNLTEVDAVGLVHYRRFFFKSGRSNDLKNLIDQADIEQLLTDHDVILPKKRNYYIETNYSHYIHAHHEEPLIETRNILVETYPQYLESFDAVMDRNKAHMFNMFVMKKEQFNAYATWLFDVLGQLETRINISDYSVQEARVFGFVAELMMDVWIETNQINYVEAKWSMTGKKQTFKKAYNFLLRKFVKNNVDISQTHF
ncbi:DUF4422 domain-containing protein [Companilactobacillus huachuanensis]|uniref:DUF4422 domain-containing protein n=1 Tax=Companilactobacillus huachuanensis TaxID=2559914 RepID=A0ABW1RMR8_9LACO|nr:DUF4422 domain-containing protein [Companilactobacillus huachuanensis]